MLKYFTLTYPFISVCSLLCFLFCNDHQFIGVSRCENPW